jgi:hypothetical protein
MKEIAASYVNLEPMDHHLCFGTIDRALQVREARQLSYGVKDLNPMPR